jgi:hypothetical protein
VLKLLCRTLNEQSPCLSLSGYAVRYDGLTGRLRGRSAKVSLRVKRQSMLASILPGTVNDLLTVKRLGCHKRTHLIRRFQGP